MPEQRSSISVAFAGLPAEGLPARLALSLRLRSVHLADGTIIVRPPALDDVAAFHAAARESSAEVGRWLPWCHAEYSAAEARNYVAGCVDAWARLERFTFFVFAAADGELLGGVGLNRIDAVTRTASLGYWLRTSRTGRGVASAAARLVCEFAFAQACLARLEIAVLPQNRASQRVAEKIGAKLQGVAAKRIVMHGESYDAMLYRLLPSDLSRN